MLNASIAGDPAVGPELFTRLTSEQHSSGLLHGSRPICPFLRPHILSRSQYDAIARASEMIAGAFERIVSAALEDKAIMASLGLSPREDKMARIEPGYTTLCVNSRLDAYLTQDSFHFLEYNAENPAGIADQMLLEKILFGLGPVKDILARHLHWEPRPHRRLLNALLQTYCEWGGSGDQPNIAIVDWKGVATASEFSVLKGFFDSEGCETRIVDPSELSYDGNALMVGTFRIDILYKRVIIHEFLEKFDERHPLVRAYEDQKICMANSFRVKVAHKKSAFAILTDSQYEDLFTEEQLACIRRHVPWTRRVAEGEVTFEDGKHELLDLLRLERDRMVLKPNDDYGGAGVVIGWEASAREWEKAIGAALKKPYVVQERVRPTKTIMPVFDTQLHFDNMVVDFDPFLFLNHVEGGLVRLSSSSLSNISAGGGETALVILEDVQ